LAQSVFEIGFGGCGDFSVDMPGLQQKGDAGTDQLDAVLQRALPEN